MSEQETDLSGVTIDATIEIRSELGTGGAGTVWLAFDHLTGSEVALKILKPDPVEGNRSFQRFANEAKLCSSLDHPYIVKPRRFGIYEGSPYLVSEFAQGDPLNRIIPHLSLPKDVPSLIGLFIGCCDALQHAHDKQIVHRDIKPSNILVKRNASQWEPKIVDFGIAKLLSDSGLQKLTRSGAILGTPLYVSPEQCSGSAVDARSDIYSLGCVMYECFTGRPPFSADSSYSLLMAHMTETALPPSKLNPALKRFPEIDSIIARMLAKEPDQRYQSMNEVAEALRTRQVVIRLPWKKIAAGAAAVIVVALGTMYGYKASQPQLSSSMMYRQMDSLHGADAALVMERLERSRQILATAEKDHELAPDGQRKCHEYIGSGLMQTGKFKEAMDEFEKSIHLGEQCNIRMVDGSAVHFAEAAYHAGLSATATQKINALQQRLSSSSDRRGFNPKLMQLAQLINYSGQGDWQHGLPLARQLENAFPGEHLIKMRNEARIRLEKARDLR